MSNLTAGQIAYLAQQAGIPHDQLQTAVAIALAESGGNPASVNNNPGTGDLSYGLWQINMIGGLGPDRRRQYNLGSNEALEDPATNARVMAAMSNHGTNWRPWSTYTSGKYKQFWGPAAAAPSGGGGGLGGLGAVIGGLVGGITGQAGQGAGMGAQVGADPGGALSLALPTEVTDFFVDAEKAVHGALWWFNPTHIVRVISGLAGGVCILLGLVFLSREVR